MQKLFFSVYRFLASLKLAVFVLLSLVFSLTTATVLESLYDISTGRYYVYSATWFHGLLALLGVNIFASAMIRFPWQKKHIPFLLAHVGILTLLFGSWITQRGGIDGNLRVEEGQSNAAVEMDKPVLFLMEGEKANSIPIRWQPPGVKFSPFSVTDYGYPYDLKVDRFITHAEPVFDFKERKPNSSRPALAARPALQFTVSGGPMRISQEFWLWTGDPGWSSFQAGPAWFELKQAGGAKLASTDAAASAQPQQKAPPGAPTLTFTLGADGSISYLARSARGEKVSGRFAAGQIEGKTIDPHWKGVKISVTRVIRDAWVSTTYRPSRTQYGDLAPSSAIHVIAGNGGDDAEVWLGIGSRAMLHASGHEVEIGYFNQRIILPFSVRLDRFNISYYEGSTKPASYSSEVTVPGAGPGRTDLKQTISMNNPLQHSGITLYQASYEDGSPRPTVSIFSVNQDPGRPLKYSGSLLIVFGTILLFASKYRRRAKNAPAKTEEAFA